MNVVVAVLFDVLWIGVGAGALLMFLSRHFTRGATIVLSALLIASFFVGASLPQKLMGLGAIGMGFGFLTYFVARRLKVTFTKSALLAVTALALLSLGGLLPGAIRFNF